MSPCPLCSTFRHGIWTPCRPSLHYGQHSHRHTLNACTTGCQLFGDGPGWIRQYAGLVPFSGVDELMPRQIRTRQHCETVLTRWWRRRLSRFDFRKWPADKLEQWRQLSDA